MAVPGFDVLIGMDEFFRSKGPIQAIIANRLYDTISNERILAVENPSSEHSPRTGPFVEYDDSAGEAAQNLDAESTYNVMVVDFRFFAPNAAQVRDLFTAFYDALGLDSSNNPTNRYRTATDGTGKWNGKTIKQANWDLGTRAMVYDETFRMANYTCSLVIRFASS